MAAVHAGPAPLTSADAAGVKGFAREGAKQISQRRTLVRTGQLPLWIGGGPPGCNRFAPPLLDPNRWNLRSGGPSALTTPRRDVSGVRCPRDGLAV